MSISKKFVADYVALSEASYADFSQAISSNSGNYTYKEDEVKSILTKPKKQRGEEMAESLATLITNKYERCSLERSHHRK